MTLSIPSFSYPIMDSLCKELQQTILNYHIIDCLPHNPLRFSFILEQSQQKKALFFCFERPFLRFHLSSFSPFRKCKSYHPLLNLIQGGIITDISLLQTDRILQLAIERQQHTYLFIAEFFTKHPNYYLTSYDRTVLFSLHPFSSPIYHLPPKPLFSYPPLPFPITNIEIENHYRLLEKEWEFKEKKTQLEKKWTKSITLLQKKKKFLENALIQCEHWPHIQHEGELIKSQLSSIYKGAASATLVDWTTGHPYVITLDPTKTPQEEMLSRFKKAKKLRTGVSHLTRQLNFLEKELAHALDTLNLIRTLSSIKELLPFDKSLASVPSSPKKSNQASSISSKCYKEFFSKSGMKIWVGKSAKYNDYLTFQLAHGRDWWLHIRDYPGSHVIIRANKDQEPDDETIQDAMQLALYYSQGRKKGCGEVCITQRKYVSKMGKKKVGQVQLSKHTLAAVHFDPLRFEKIKNRFKD